MSEALIIIDMSNDFVHDNGSLSCKEAGQKIVPNILALANKMLADGHHIVIAMDEHPGGVDGAWPKHNATGTWGCELYGDLKKWFDSIVFNSSGAVRMFYLPKTKYDAFFETGLALELKLRKVDHVHLVGVCTDICVLFTAASAYSNGFKVTIHKSAVATFSDLGEAALKMAAISLQAEIVE